MIKTVPTVLLTAVCCLSAGAQSDQSWINPRGGYWLSAQNWSGGRVPNNTPAERFDATFKLTSAQPYTAVVNGKIVIDHLRLESSRATITVPSGSSLSVAASGVLDAGTLRLLGGKLSGGEWIAAPGVLDVGNFATTEFAGVKWRGDIVLGAVGNQFRISGGLALNGRLALTSGGTTVTFDGPQAILGGNISLSPATNSSTLLLAQGANVTLSPSTYLNGGGGDFVGDGTLINKGRIKADRASTTLSIGPKKFINAGRMEGLAGATLVIGDSSGTWMQTADAAISASGTLTLRGEWSNQGTISTSNATVNLNGSFNSNSLERFSPAGGTVNISGTWDNRDHDFFLAGANTWNLSGGRVYGGHLVSTAGLPLRISGNGSALEDITVEGPVVLASNARLNLGEGAHVPGPITFANDATVRYLVTSEMQGQTFIFSGFNNRFSVAADAELTIGQTLEGASFSIRSDTGGSVRNESTIRASSGKTVIVEPTWFANAGVCETTGGTLKIGFDTSQRAWTNLPGGIVRGVNATLELGGTWSNEGMIETTDTAIRLRGMFHSSDLQGLSMSGGSLTLMGTLDNSDNTLVLNAATGNWNLLGTPAIVGGILRFADGAHFTLTSGTRLDLENLDIADRFDLVTDGIVHFARDASARGGLYVTAGAIYLEPGRTWETDARFENALGASLTINEEGYLLLGPDNLIHGGSVTLSAIQGARCENQGTIRADAPGRSITLSGLIDNAGLIEAAGGGHIVVGTLSGFHFFTNLADGLMVADAASRLSLSGKFANYGSLTTDGGILEISFDSESGNYGLIEIANSELSLRGPRNYGTIRAINSALTIQGDYSTPDLGDLQNEGGTVRILGGTIDNEGHTLYQNAETGSWSVGPLLTIRGGVIDQSGGVNLSFGDTGGTNPPVFDGVTVRGDLIISNSWSNATLLIPNGIAMESGAIRVGTGSELRIRNTIDDVNIVLSGPPTTSAGTLVPDYSGGNPVIFGPGLSVTGNGRIVDPSRHLINRGSIVATTGQIRVSLQTFTNEGSIGVQGGTLYIGDSYPSRSWVNATSGRIVLNSGSIETAGVWSNDGLFEVRNATANLRGTYTTEEFNSVTIENSTVSLGQVQNAGSVFDFDNRARLWRIGGTVTGGSIRRTGTVGVQTAGCTLNGVTLDSDLPMLLTDSGLTIGPAGLNLDDHTLTLDGSGQTVRIEAPGVGIAGPGTLVFTGLTNNIYGWSSGGALIVNPGVVIRGRGVTVGSDQYRVVNQGTLSADVAGGSIRMYGGNPNYTNEGLVEARNGGSARLLTTSRLTNITGNTLRGGQWAVYAGSTLVFENADIRIVDADLTVSGTGSVLAEIAGLTEVSGSFTLDQGRHFATVGDLVNTGVIRIGRESALAVNGTFDQVSSGMLAFNLAGSTPTAYGQLTTLTGASLSGTIEIALVDGFTPQLGDSFVLVTGGALSGQFANVILPDLSTGLQFDVQYTGNAVELHVIPQ